MKGRAVRGAVMALVFLVGGCFQYTPLESVSQVRDGMLVRAHLSEPRELEVGDLIFPRVVMAEGDILRAENDSLVIGVGGVLQEAGIRRTTPRLLLGFDHRQIQRVEQKTMNLGRTALVVGGIGAVAVLVGTKLFGGTSSDGGQNPNPDPDPLGFRGAGIRIFGIPLGF